MGHTVVLVEPSRHIGGLTSGGLGMTDSGNKAAIGGLSRQFYQRVKAHYSKASAWKQEKPEEYRYLTESKDALWRFEPKVAEAILREMLAEHRIAVVEGQRLDLKPGGVTKDSEKARITAIRMESGLSFSGKIFIDATYEGDLMAKAGVSYAVGREANAQYGEALNGVQVKRSTKHQFTKPVDPYVKPGDPTSGLLPGVQKEGPGTEGGADHRVQAYNFRLCMTKVAENKIPWPKPEGYDPLRYELGLRYALAGNRVWHSPDMMPNKKTDTNNSGGFSTDNIGRNYAYPDGDYATRESIFKEHETYQKGFYYFFANDPRVPADLRKEFSSWGLAKDEYPETGGWPHQLYIREARRMVGMYVHTEQDCRRTRVTPASIGLGSYNMDSHNVQRYVDPATGMVRNEGDIQESPHGAYMISYQSIVPKKNECQNLLVPVCVSSSHIAYGSIRMEPVFMILGQSAATAASQAIKTGVAVQDVPYEPLREALVKEGQVLVPPSSSPASQPSAPAVYLDPTKLPGIVVDGADAKLTGAWEESSANQPYVAESYLHDGNTAKGELSAVFTLKIPSPGKYEVRLSWPPNTNRATNVPVSITTGAAAAVKATVNQQKKPDQGTFHSLGVHHFSEATATVTIRNADTDGFVIVDAVQLLPVKN